MITTKGGVMCSNYHIGMVSQKDAVFSGLRNFGEMSEYKSAVIGSVFERKPGLAPAAPKVFTSGATGFPAVQHRSKSAFARSREKNNRSSRPQGVPTIIQSDRKANIVASDEWREQVGRENQERVESMSEEDRAEERRDIIARFGSGLGDLLKRVQQARIQKAANTDEAINVDHNQSTVVNGDPALDEGTSIYSLHMPHHS